MQRRRLGEGRRYSEDIEANSSGWRSLKRLGLPEGAVQALERGGLHSKISPMLQPRPRLILKSSQLRLRRYPNCFQMGTALKNSLVSAAFDMIKTDLSD
jgi:hypothetical protein